MKKTIGKASGKWPSLNRYAIPVSASAMFPVAIALAIAITVSSGMISCAWSSTPMPKDIVATEKDSGKTFIVYKGSLAQIRLAGNPTTGYVWSLGPESANDLVMKALDPTEGEYLHSDLKLLGSGGTFVFKFMAANPGEATLVFNYARSWETAAPAQTFRIRFTVKDVR